MKNTITLTFCGFVCRGSAKISFWGGGSGTIDMNSWCFDAEDCNALYSAPVLKMIADGINDDGFGCESIDSADIDIYGIYKGENGACCEVYCDSLEWDWSNGFLNVPIKSAVEK